MIISAIITVLATVLTYAMQLLPAVGTSWACPSGGTLGMHAGIHACNLGGTWTPATSDSLSGFQALGQETFTLVHLVNGYFPIDTLGLCLGILWTANSFAYVANILMWLYDKIPGKMT